MAEHESLFGLQEEGHRDLKLTTLRKERAEFNSGNTRRSGLGGKGIRGPRRDQRSWIPAETGLEGTLPAFSTISEGFPGCCPASAPALEASVTREGGLIAEGMP